MPPRLRMFAGPNGSGKSTIKQKLEDINPDWLGVHVNPDDIEREINESGILSFDHFKVRTTKSQIFGFLNRADQLIYNDLVRQVSKLQFTKNSLLFEDVELNSYLVSALADFLHARLVAARINFSFETVMSHPAKIELLKKTLKAGFRNYLYYVATEDPEINVSRVGIRVKAGGHKVPVNKIRSRYYRSLDNLVAAIKFTSRAYIYDNSGAKATLLAEITNGKEITIENSNIPVWFRKYVLDKVTNAAE